MLVTIEEEQICVGVETLQQTKRMHWELKQTDVFLLIPCLRVCSSPEEHLAATHVTNCREQVRRFLGLLDVHNACVRVPPLFISVVSSVSF